MQPPGTGNLSDTPLAAMLRAGNGKLCVQFGPQRRHPRQRADVCLRGLERSTQFFMRCVGNVHWVSGRAAGLSLVHVGWKFDPTDARLSIHRHCSPVRVPLWHAWGNSEMLGVILTVLSSRRTFGIKLKITLSAMRDDEGRWMAGPWLPH